MKSIASKLAGILVATVMACGLFVASTVDAHAYVDPGTGAMILQIIGAIVAGALFYFRQIRDKISSWFARKPPGTTPSDQA